MATIPSISLIPSGYKAGKVYSVLPTDGSGDLTFARASTATRINKNNLIENVGNNVPRLDYEDGGCPSLLLEPSSTNLITQSESFGNSYWTKSGATIEGDASTAGVEQVVNGDFATDADWTKGTGWTINGGIASQSGGVGQLSQTIGVSQETLCEITFTTTISSGGITFALAPSGTNKTFTESGTYTFQGIFKGSSILYILGSSSSFIGSIDNVSVKEVSGFSAPSVDSPLGAFKLVEDTSNGEHLIITDTVTVSANKHSCSILVKPNGRSKINFRLANYFLSGTDATFDLISKQITLGSEAENGKIETLADGWFRCSFSSKSDAVAGPTAYFIIKLVDGTTSYTGDGTSGVYIFGAQLEQKSYATSYIKTSGSQITRLADTANNAGNASTFNDSEGVLMVEISALDDDSTAKSITINQSSTNILGFYYYQSRIDAYVKVGTNQFFKTHYLNPTENVKISLKYKQNDFALWINGFEVGSLVGSGITPSGLNKLSFSDLSANDFYGKTKQLQYFNTALTDLELETLTSFTSFNAMALAQNYIIQ